MQTMAIERLIARHASVHTHNLARARRLETRICQSVAPGMYRGLGEEVMVFKTHRHAGAVGNKAFVVVVEDNRTEDGFRYVPLALFHLRYVASPPLAPL